MSLFRSMPDGEYRLCRECLNRGYGVDAWWQAIPLHWPTIDGKLWFGRCRSCNADRKAGCHGIVPEDDMRMAA